MRVQCDVCEKAEAALICCADEAALCAPCDAEVHAANKLAGKHQRIPLIRPSSPSESPRCDICQEKVGWFFCVEDRALLCRNCDVSIHSANALASGHKRLLVPGVRIALSSLSPQDFLEIPEVQNSVLSNPSSAAKNIAQAETSNYSNKKTTSKPENFDTRRETTTSTPENFEVRKQTPSSYEGDGKNSSTISEYLAEGVPGWRVDELLNIPELAGGYNLSDVGSSKADAANLGEFDWLADLSLFDEQLYVQTFHEVPQISPVVAKTNKTLPIKGKGKQAFPVVSELEELLLVPDLGQPHAKRRKMLFET